MKLPEILSRIIKKNQYYVICTECGFECIGTTENHCIRNFKSHFKSKKCQAWKEEGKWKE